MSTDQPTPLPRAAAAGEHVRVVVPRGADDDAVRAHLWAADALGLWDTPDGIVAFFACTPVSALPHGATVERRSDEDWHEGWKAELTPITARRFRVVPSWLVATGRDETVRERAGRDGAVWEVVLDPGEAFGTGHHATTAMCLELLDEAERQGRLEGGRVADVGSGAGLLSIAAVRAGAGEVVACDLDPAAVAATTRNAAANDVDVRVVEGSTDAIDGPFDVVLANLLTDTITELAPRLRDLVADDGMLVVSGIGAERARGPLTALARQHLQLRTQLGRDGWVAAALTP